MKRISTQSLRGLYILTDERLGTHLESVTTAALKGGARLVQYRDKSADAGKCEREARALCALTHGHGALFLVNDDPALAAKVGADGVHLGRDDPEISSARRLLGIDAIIGVSCYDSLALARDAVGAGADYVAFGSVYPSPVKPDAVRAPLDLLTQAKRELGVPVCAIGGITPENAMPVIAAGADMLAVVSAIVFADDPQAVSRAFLHLLEVA
ncbi:MAG: thiamine phosphate synthase [Gammaproteobacteria bacterium]|nr:thiamine phosphate synthase [Gammaproteobacteria bacterium]